MPGIWSLSAESAAHHGERAATRTSVYQLTLQSANLKEIYTWAPRLMAKMRTLPGFVDVNSDLQIASPQVMVDIDRDRAQALRRDAGTDAGRAVQRLSATRQASIIYTPSNEYQVILEVEPQYQRTPDALSKLYLRSSSGSLVPLDAVVKTQRTIGSAATSTTSASCRP